MTDKESMKLALEALKELHNTNSYWWQEVDEQTIKKIKQSITALEEVLAQPEQEPVAWMDADGNVSDNNDHKCFPIPLYTITPPQRKPLTDEQIQQIVLTAHGNQDWTLVFARAIEAAHGIKENT
jgi:hypothetical protein